jgi:hypothetical protein
MHQPIPEGSVNFAVGATLVVARDSLTGETPVPPKNATDAVHFVHRILQALEGRASCPSFAHSRARA